MKTEPSQMGPEAGSATPYRASPMVSLSWWMEQMGVGACTVWRWRKRGMLRVTNIYGRLYLSQEAIAEFNARAQRGEFTPEAKGPRRGSAWAGQRPTAGRDEEMERSRK
ncbi:MAG: hypothetical protein HY735_06735 [Verrucomicrobia bacterium]|nr:hypothetical protein [Verrucomicrobiota bacterium]